MNEDVPLMTTTCLNVARELSKAIEGQNASSHINMECGQLAHIASRLRVACKSSPSKPMSVSVRLLISQLDVDYACMQMFVDGRRCGNIYMGNGSKAERFIAALAAGCEVRGDEFVLEDADIGGLWAKIKEPAGAAT